MVDIVTPRGLWEPTDLDTIAPHICFENDSLRHITAKQYIALNDDR